MIQFDQVSFSYEKAHKVLDCVSFQIDRGESVGLIGANGTGKTTIMKAALGLLSCEGSIRVDGTAVTKKTLPGIRKKLGYVLQDSDNQMFMSTVLEDMIFGPVNYGASREEAVKKAEEVLQELNILSLKEKYNYKISGGEKKMAAIAVILAMEPAAILMDEPSANLDPRNRRQLIRILNQLKVTKIIASHDLDLILDTCERVILLEEGRIAADGKADVILRDQALLERCGLELPFVLQGRQ